MLRPIDLNNQPGFATVKVQDVATELMLATELRASELAPSK
jgi:hypothetical protein